LPTKSRFPHPPPFKPIHSILPEGGKWEISATEKIQKKNKWRLTEQIKEGAKRIKRTPNKNKYYLKHGENLLGKYVDATVDQGGDIGGWLFHEVQDAKKQLTKLSDRLTRLDLTKWQVALVGT
jgi:hypothetical protein